MASLKYTYDIDADFIIIDDLQAGESVLRLIKPVVAEIEAAAGPVGGKYIIWRDTEGIWNLLLPRDYRTREDMAIYSLSTFDLTEAKARLKAVVTIGNIPGLSS